MTIPPAANSPWGAFAIHDWRLRWLKALHAIPSAPAWRRVGLWLRKPLKNSLPPVVDHDIWGLRLRLNSRGNLSEQRLLLLPQHLDAIERQVLARELSKGGVFFDVGANIGVYTLWVASACRDSVRVEAFEPDPTLCGRLAFNLETNGLSQVHLNQVALGRSEGTATLVSGDGNSGENRVESITSPSGGFTVRMTTLAEHVRQKGIARIDAMKIDVEGHEMDVLEPFFETAPRSVWPRLLISERVHEAGQGISQLLASRGYILASHSRLNGIYRLSDSPSTSNA
ncbi:MAG TPA: FkbM family methyltransferase [Roseimicrobium sp.]|nr:FkbM family methyltransferase [Roseimicrobium sp.]